MQVQDQRETSTEKRRLEPAVNFHPICQEDTEALPLKSYAVYARILLEVRRDGDLH